MEALYSVVTIFTDNDGRMVVHSYGPFTNNQASYYRKQWESDHDPRQGTFTTHATKLLDPEKRSPFIWARA